MDWKDVASCTFLQGIQSLDGRPVNRAENWIWEASDVQFFKMYTILNMFASPLHEFKCEIEFVSLRSKNLVSP
jgi:hypothetical protein